jgi:hypothetical protein
MLLPTYETTNSLPLHLSAVDAPISDTAFESRAAGARNMTAVKAGGHSVVGDRNEALSLAAYSTDPTGRNSLGPSAVYAGILSGGQGSGFESYNITLCARRPLNYARWWNGTSWAPVASTPTSADHLCVAITADKNSSPSARDIANTYVAGGYDDAAPSLKLTARNGADGSQAYASGAWSTTNVSVQLEAQDALPGSGISGVYYAVDSRGCTATQITGCQKYTAPVTVSASGAHKLVAFAIDGAGQVAAQTLDVRIDRALPVTTAQVVTVGDKSVFTLSATDVGSGVAVTQYTVNGYTTLSYTGPISLPLGTRIYVRSIDQAGNIGIWHRVSST